MNPLLLLCPLLQSSPAQAAHSATVLHIEGRYQLEVGVTLPDPILLRAMENREGRAARFEVRLVTTCSPEAADPLALRCDVNDVALSALALQADEGSLGLVLQQYDQLLTGAWVQISFKKDGTLSHFDLEGIDQDDRRAGVVIETLRQLLLRAYAGLELSAPDAFAADSAWSQKGTRILEHLRTADTITSGVVKHHVAGLEASQAQIESTGGGSMTLHPEGSPDGPSMILAGDNGGRAVVDLAERALVGRDWWMTMASTASSVPSGGALYALDAKGNGRIVYVQAGLVRRLDPAEPAPELGESGENSFASPASEIMQRNLDQLLGIEEG